jgi:adenylate cyclase
MPDQVIAIAEDEEEIRTRLEAFLTTAGYRVVVSENASSILECARSQRFDAFILDIEIGGEDGIELCRRLRAMEAYRFTPILCITGLYHPEIVDKIFEAGANDFVPKPLNDAALKARLKAQIQKVDYFGKLERTRQMLQRYLSPRVAEIAKAFSETGEVPRPMERQVSICMTDIRGFTALSETMDTSKLFSLLSAHLKDQIELVYHHGGYVDKFNGDGLMAVFDGEGMEERCCVCALEIMELTSARNGGAGKFPIGIGIHTGRVVMGNIGSAQHLDFTAIGTSVNLAARLCGYAQPETIIVSDAVRDAIGEHARMQFLSRRDVQVRGVSGPVTIYRLIDRLKS